MSQCIACMHEPTLSLTDRAVALELEVLANTLRLAHHYIAARIVLERVVEIREG